MLEKLETELRIAGHSERTISSYKFRNKQFLDFIKKDPSKINTEDLKKYLGYLIERGHKKNSINLSLSALKYFFHNVIKNQIFDETIKWRKIRKKEPTVLNQNEVKKLLNVIKNPKHRILIELMASSGLRVSEAVSLRIKDIDFDNRMIIVKSGKGDKDRRTIIAQKTLDKIKIYLMKRNDGNPYLFNIRDTHVTIKLPQKIIKEAASRAKIDKRIYCHALRATFATELHERGVDVLIIQTLLGHENLDTTRRYTNIARERLKQIKSPIDLL